MVTHYLKIFYRTLSRYKLYSLINIAGLALGMAACLLILLYIQQERSFDNQHADAERIFRVLTIDDALGTHGQRVGITMPALGPALPENFSQIEAALRLSGGGRNLLQYQERPAIYAERLRYTDANFFDFFNFPLVQGDPQTALTEPNSIVLTESLANSIFGEEIALGKNLRTGSGLTMKVTGILRDLPDNTHLAFDALFH